MKKIEKLWVEKFRPKTTGDVVFSNPAHKKKVERYIESGSIPNILLYGPPGTGKTTISKVLVRGLGVNKADVLTINCSDEKIDAARDKVKAFSMTMPIGNFKIVRLEEFDNIGVDAQLLLRSVIEDCSATCRFIATCNYVNKLLPEMRSRFTSELEFKSPDLESMLIRCGEILEKESVEFTIDNLEQVVALAYPDFRKTIQLLESSVIDGKLVLDRDTEIIPDWKLQLLDLIEVGDIQQARRVVCSSASKAEMPDVFRFMYLNIHKLKGLKQLDQAYVEIAQFQFQHNFVADPEIQLAAMFIKLSRLM